MNLNLQTLRLMLSGAIVGVALAGLFGADTSSVSTAIVAALSGAGLAYFVLKSLRAA